MSSLQLYDKERGASELECLALERLASEHPQVQIAQLTETAGWPDQYMANPDGTVWRLAFVPSQGGDNVVEEAVITFQGVLEKVDLPPYKEKPNERNNQAKYVRQSIVVGGLGTPTFQKVVDNVAAIHALFRRAMGRDEVEECVMIGEEGEEKVLYPSNRYFTAKKEAQNAPSVILTPEVDPHGYLARMKGDNYVHIEDNHVYYFEKRRIPGTDNFQFAPCHPIKFRVGDLVEVQVSFVLLNLREGKKRTSMILRSLLLLDGNFTQKAMVDEITKRGAPKITQTLKRRVGYDGVEATTSKVVITERHGGAMKRKVGYIEEEVSETSTRLSKMDIDDERDELEVEEGEVEKGGRGEEARLD